MTGHRWRHLFVLAMCCIFAVDGMAQGQDTAIQRPNILFCIADDASQPHFGAYGCDWVKTPHFDRIAKEGLLFHRAYTPNAKCAPSRACIITGRNPWQLGAAVNHVPFFPTEFKSYSEVLQEAGYHVGFTAKGYAPGEAFDKDEKRRTLTGKQYNEQKCTPPTNAMSNIDYAANFDTFMDERDGDTPFCFWYGGFEPHRRYEYGSGAKAGKKIADIDAIPPFWPDNETVRNDLLDYALEIEYFDTHLGRMLENLEARGELDNTIIVVTADNGMPFPRVKGQAYEYSNHLPLAIMWPEGIEKPGRTIDSFVSFIDFAPTFLELAGVDESSSGMQSITGRSLSPIFRNETQQHRDHVLIGKERHDIGRPDDGGYPVRGMVQGDYLYIENFAPDRWPAGNPETGYLNCDGSPTKTLLLEARTNPEMNEFWAWSFGKRPATELYNIRNDPACMVNLANEEKLAALHDTMREELFAELRVEGDPRMLSRGHIFDEYPYADKRTANFYNRYMAGEQLKAGWVNESDFEEGVVE